MDESFSRQAALQEALGKESQAKEAKIKEAERLEEALRINQQELQS